jgi:hypothetical protein
VVGLPACEIRVLVGVGPTAVIGGQHPGRGAVLLQQGGVVPGGGIQRSDGVERIRQAVRFRG